jgi:hypothetical protein
MIRNQFAFGILFFPGVKLSGGNIVSPAQLSRAGSLSEKLSGNRSFRTVFVS